MKKTQLVISPPLADIEATYSAMKKAHLVSQFSCFIAMISGATLLLFLFPIIIDPESPMIVENVRQTAILGALLLMAFVISAPTAPASVDTYWTLRNSYRSQLRSLELIEVEKNSISLTGQKDVWRVLWHLNKSGIISTMGVPERGSKSFTDKVDDILLNAPTVEDLHAAILSRQNDPVVKEKKALAPFAKQSDGFNKYYLGDMIRDPVSFQERWMLAHEQGEFAVKSRCECCADDPPLAINRPLTDPWVCEDCSQMAIDDVEKYLDSLKEEH